jgi:3-hydroxyacyl-CoA dehydrogenase/3-hydroxy-2-methylbutyryl-CoA dehydrogenase
VRSLVDGNARAVIVDRANPQESFPADRVLFIRTDLTRLEEVARAVADTVAWTEQTGAILGGVINSAGVGIDEPVRAPFDTRPAPHPP